MTSIERLHPDTLRALKARRANFFHINYWHPDLPDHASSGICLPDTRSVDGLLVKDKSDLDFEQVRMWDQIGPSCLSERSFGAPTVAVLHALRYARGGGRRDGYLRLRAALDAPASEQAAADRRKRSGQKHRRAKK